MKQRPYFIIIFFFLVIFNLPGQAGRTGIISFDFVEQEIREILFAFSSYSGISIIGDDTITGRGSFQYNGSDFEQAFDAFLLSNRLFTDKNDNVWIVSRIKLDILDDNSIIINSLDATINQLMENLARETNTSILRDVLPPNRVSLHLNGNNPLEVVELIMKPFPDYSVISTDRYIHIRRETQDPFATMNRMSPGTIIMNEANGIFEVEVENARLIDVLDRLFLLGRREYLSFIRPEQIIERIRFSDKDFLGSLLFILEQGSSEHREIDDLYYIFPMQQTDFISSIRNQGKNWQLFELKYRNANDVSQLIQSRFGNQQFITLPDNRSLLIFIDDNTSLEILDFLPTVDIPSLSAAIRLKYIRTEDLFRKLPPSVRRDELVDAGDGNTFFYIGSEERKAIFLRDLEIIDRPQPRIRYDLFIIQIQDTGNLSWSNQAEARLVRPGDRTMVTGIFGNLLNLNFDVISVFGYQFAAKLNSAISENRASVFADTTLFGLSGQEIKFQNTNTFRYRDSNIDPETGRPFFSGITREIVSGLVLDITGWVSGDGMITTTLTASVSKRGADLSSGIGNPPPTSEKILTTQVRAQSGETVILSGLRQNDTTIIEQRMPLLSRIPVLGWLFQSKNNTNENTQMIIYLVPHLDIGNDEYTVNGLKTASIYSRFVERHMEGR